MASSGNGDRERPAVVRNLGKITVFHNINEKANSKLFAGN